MSGAGLAGESRLLRGIDDFNAGLYFEAHEVWEDLWRELSGEDRLFVQALIQAAVALHHAGRDNAAGARQLFKASLAKLALLPATRSGVDCDGLSAALSEGLARLEGAGPSAGLGRSAEGPRPCIRRVPDV